MVSAFSAPRNGKQATFKSCYTIQTGTFAGLSWQGVSHDGAATMSEPNLVRGEPQWFMFAIAPVDEVGHQAYPAVLGKRRPFETSNANIG